MIKLNPKNIKFLVIHHTVSSRDKTTVEDVNSWHKARWPNFRSSLGFWVGYHFLVLGDGRIIQTRKDNEMGAHCITNDGKVGICLTGNFEIEKPSEQQIASLKGILERLKKDYNITDSNIKGHCELSRTLCPGRHLMDWLKGYRRRSILIRIIQILLRKKIVR